MNKITLKVDIEIPCNLSAIQRIQVREAAICAALEKAEDLIEQQRKSILEQTTIMVMNRFDLTPSDAKLSPNCVLNLSGAYTSTLCALNSIKERRYNEQNNNRN